MSARLVLILLAALAIFDSAQAVSCSTTIHGNPEGIQTETFEFIEKGQNSITLNLHNPSINPCGNIGNTNGLVVKVCAPAGTAHVHFDDSTAVVRRSSTASTVAVVLQFYCRR